MMIALNSSPSLRCSQVQEIEDLVISDVKARVKEVVDCLRDKGKLGEINADTFTLLLNTMGFALNPAMPLVADASDLYALLKRKKWDVKNPEVQAFLDAAQAPMPILARATAPAPASAAGGASAGMPPLASVPVPAPAASLAASGAGILLPPALARELLRVLSRAEVGAEAGRPGACRCFVVGWLVREARKDHRHPPNACRLGVGSAGAFSASAVVEALGGEGRRVRGLYGSLAFAMRFA
jgi:hypothetical protein